MNYDEILDTIANSHNSQWNVIPCWGSGSGPSYKDKLETYISMNGGNSEITVESHGMYACFKPDISISLAFGLKHVDYFNEEWANKFSDPDSRAISKYLDVFYNNSLVERIIYVVVDGGRAKLPIPEAIDNLVVKKRESLIIRLIDSLESGDENYENYFKQAGLKVI